jgi:hypothetical protein
VAHLARGRILLNVAQKRRLATAVFKVGRKLLHDCATFFSSDTLLKWHRMLVARKYGGAGKRGPKAKKANEVRAQVLRMKAENPDWGMATSTANSRDWATKSPGRRSAES